MIIHQRLRGIFAVDWTVTGGVSQRWCKVEAIPQGWFVPWLKGNMWLPNISSNFSCHRHCSIAVIGMVGSLSTKTEKKGCSGYKAGKQLASLLCYQQQRLIANVSYIISYIHMLEKLNHVSSMAKFRGSLVVDWQDWPSGSKLTETSGLANSRSSRELGELFWNRFISVFFLFKLEKWFYGHFCLYLTMAGEKV